MEGPRMLGIADYVVITSVLVISTLIGIFYKFTGGKQKSTEEYLLADRNMGVLPVSFSLMASFMSAITILGVASENYTFGTQFVVINFAYIIGTPIVAFLYLPVFYNLRRISAYEYLEKRFGRPTRFAASISFQLQMVFYMGIVLYAPALALNTVTGLSKWGSILAVGIACIIYSTIGGMKAVLWTDVFQSLLMFAAIFIVLFNGIVEAGGVSSIWSTAYQGGRIEFFRFDIDPTVRHTFWTQCLGGIFTYTSIYGVNQGQIQRLLTLRSLKHSQRALFISWPILTLLSLTTSFCGLVLYYTYNGCDPMSSKRIERPDQLLPFYVMDTMSSIPGIAGLFISGIFSGTLSTVSSACNSLAAVTLEDYIRPYLTHDFSDKKLATFSKGLVLAYGILCLAMTVLAEQLDGILQASLTIFGVVGGPILGLFTLGMCFTKCNQKGALLGLLSGLVICSWFGFGASFSGLKPPRLPVTALNCTYPVNSSYANLTYSAVNNYTVNEMYPTASWGNGSAQLIAFNASEMDSNSTILDNKHSIQNNVFYPYRISYMWLAPIGFFITVAMGLFVSLVTGGNELLDSSLISPPFHRIYKFHNLNREVEPEFVEKHPLNHKSSNVDDSLECNTSL